MLTHITHTQSTNLHFFAMFADDFHQPREQVGHGVGGDGLTERSKHLEGSASVVTRRATQGRLQCHVAELLLQVEI